VGGRPLGIWQLIVEEFRNLVLPFDGSLHKPKTPETLRLLASSNGNPVAHRIMHRPSLPAIKLRVGRILDLPAQPWLRFQVAPSPLPLAEPASDSDGCPSSSSLRLCRRSPFEFPRTSDAFSAAGFCGVPGFPGGARSSCIACDTVLRLPLVPYLRLYRRWIVESPRFSHLSAVPVVKAPGCPFALRPRYRRRSVSRLPRILILRHRLVNSPSHLGFAPSGSPSSNLRIAPSTRFGLRQLTNPQVALVLALSTSPIPSVPSRPETSFLG
jgi:hypothetical protein